MVVLPNSFQIRRSKLVVSPLSDGNSLKNAAASSADALIVDLIQTVPDEFQSAARSKAGAVLKTLSATGSDLFLWVSPRGVREALEDCWVPRLTGIVVSAESVEQVRAVEAALAAWEREKRISEQLQIDLVLASGQAVLLVYELISAGTRIVSLTLDEDSLLAELGVERSYDIDQLLYSRGRLVIVARMCQVQAHCLGFVAGEASVRERAIMGRKIGLRGVLCFNPEDVAAVNQGFSPTPEEVDTALAVKAAMEEAVRKGLGAASLPGGQMVDMAMFKHSQALLRWAEAIKAKESRKQRGGAEL